MAGGSSPRTTNKSDDAAPAAELTPQAMAQLCRKLAPGRVEVKAPHDPHDPRGASSRIVVAGKQPLLLFRGRMRAPGKPWSARSFVRGWFWARGGDAGQLESVGQVRALLGAVPAKSKAARTTKRAASQRQVKLGPKTKRSSTDRGKARSGPASNARLR